MGGLLGIVAATLIISPSGALSPGPLSASAVALGARGRGVREGLLTAVGHMLFELPYVYLLTRSLGYISALTGARRMLTLASASFIFLFACLTLRDAFKNRDPGGGGSAMLYGSAVTGLVLTGLNPFFLAWWPSVALPIIEEAAALGTLGFAAMYASHIWYDFAWLGLLAYAGRRGTEALGGRMYSVLLGLLGAMLIVFGVNMVLRTYMNASILPF